MASGEIGGEQGFFDVGQVGAGRIFLALCDDDGPAGTPVKDAQRTKTHPATRATVSIVWGSNALPGRTARATAWYRALSAAVMGAAIDDVELA